MSATSTALQPVASSVPLARRFVREALLTLGADGASADAELLVSELATNAVLHARTEFTVAVARDGDSVRIRVQDLSRLLPRKRDYAKDSTTGRGIRLVESLSSGWGVDREGGGKVVWFDLPAPGNAEFVPTWDEETDVDELLAAFGESGEPVAPSREVPPASLRLEAA